MKKKIMSMAFAILATGVMLVSCKKTDTNAAENTDLTTHGDDQALVSGQIDDVANDANTVIDNYVAFNGKVENTTGTVCGATTAIDSAGGLRRITVTYNGLNCAGTRNRVGVVVYSMPLTMRWKDAGAVLTVSIQNLKITRVADNKSITINGTHLVTNVTGGRLRDLASLGTIIHTITSSDMSLTFDNGSQRLWQVARKRVFTYDNGIVITTTGTKTDGAVSGIAEWGTNRFGNPFVTVINQALVIRQDCNFRLTSGQVTHQKLASNVVVTFGLDANGNPVSCPTGNYYYKIVWTNANGVVRTFILPY
jgi:hypothetical protein